MSVYKLHPNGGVTFVKGYEGKYDMLVPFDIANPDFLDYGRWLLAGNVPDPVVLPAGYPGGMPDPMPYTLVDIQMELNRLAPDEPTE